MRTVPTLQAAQEIRAIARVAQQQAVASQGQMDMQSAMAQRLAQG